MLFEFLGIYEGILKGIFDWFCFLSLQSNSLLVPDSLRSTDKRRNGPEYSNDIKKRKVDDKDSSHYVSKSVSKKWLIYLQMLCL